MKPVHSQYAPVQYNMYLPISHDPGNPVFFQLKIDVYLIKLSRNQA